MGRVSIVLITFDSARFIPRCAAGILNQSFPEIEIVVIDNASSDGSVDAVRSHLPQARITINPTNRGFAAAANQGIAQAGGEFILLLNPDVYLNSDYAAFLAGALQSWARFGSATGKLLRGTGESIEPTAVVDSKGIRMTRSGRHFDIDAGEQDALETQPAEVFGVSGAAAMYRRSFLEDAAIGGEIFDEDFFAYREDADLSWRGQLFGWGAIYIPAAVAYHVRRVTPENRAGLPAAINMHSVKNRFLLRLKNESLSLAIRNAPLEISRDLIVLAATLTVERTSLPAWRWLWQHRGRIMTKRRAIQSRRRVSDREIFHWFQPW